MQKPFFNADKLQVEVFSLNNNKFESSQFSFLKQHYPSLEQDNLYEITPTSKVELKEALDADIVQPLDTEKYSFVETGTPIPEKKIQPPKIQDFSNDLDQIFADFDREVSQVLSPKGSPLENSNEDIYTINNDSNVEVSTETYSNDNTYTINNDSNVEVSTETYSNDNTYTINNDSNVEVSTETYSNDDTYTLNNDSNENTIIPGTEVIDFLNDTLIPNIKEDHTISEQSLINDSLEPKVSSIDSSEIIASTLEEEIEYAQQEKNSIQEIEILDTSIEEEEDEEKTEHTINIPSGHVPYEELEEISVEHIFLNDSYSQDDEFITPTDIVINDQEESTKNDISMDLLQQLNNNIATTSTPMFADLNLHEVKEIMKEIDELLGALPDEKIEELAHKEFYHNYIKFLDDLGI
ncbi:MAG: hypothetical protein ACRCWI_06415 [Brevinema sp.]